MKLAEAIIERSNLEKANQDLISKLRDNAVILKDENPEYNMVELYSSLSENYSLLNTLIDRVTNTNHHTKYDETMSLYQAINRKTLREKRVAELQTLSGYFNRSRTRTNKDEKEKKTTMSPKFFSDEIDRIKKECNELNVRIQALNWTTELI